jgi:hypothetical protein
MEKLLLRLLLIVAVATAGRTEDSRKSFQRIGDSVIPLLGVEEQTSSSV